MSKEEMRKRLKELSFADKIKILERLRDRSVLLVGAGYECLLQRICQGKPLQKEKRNSYGNPMGQINSKSAGSGTARKRARV